MKDTHQDIWWMFWQGSKFDAKKFKDDEQNVLDLYKKNGYIDASIRSPSLR